MKARFFVTVLIASLWMTHGHAGEVVDLGPIIREMKIAKDVFRSSMSNSISDEIRISSVEAQYLAQQGVLITINVIRPWFRVNKTGQHITIDANFQSMGEIPEVVRKIFSDLQISIPRYDPDELDELRELRAEQRGLRKEERELQAKSRVKRRELVRADDADERDEVTEDISDLERELRGVQAQIDALNADLDKQYERLSATRLNSISPDPQLDLDAAVAETTCNYGTTFKSLGDQEFLTVAIKQRELTRYFVFKMEHIAACSHGDIDSGELLERSYVYQT